MKYLVAACTLLATAWALAAPPVPQPTGGLRQLLQQYHRTAASAPRQLSAGERAELRRQIAGTAHPEAAVQKTDHQPGRKTKEE